MTPVSPTPASGRRAVLHIGLPKTGTTALQAALAGARGRLPGDGWHFARSPGAGNHQRLLSLIAVEGGPPFAAAAARRLVASEGGRLVPLLRAEMEALPPHIHTVLFSNEHLGGFVEKAEQALALRRALTPYFDRFRIVAYIRRQDLYALSDFSQVLRAGQRRRNPLDARPKDYWAMLSCWSEAFGQEVVAPRIYDRAELVGGDILQDFRSLLGMPALAVPAGGQANASLGGVGLALLQRLNALWAEQGVPEPDAQALRRRFLPVLAAMECGLPWLPARAAAEAFVARRAESNERVRATWFPGRASLFSSDFGLYPEAAEIPPSDGEVLGFALRLLTRMARQADEQH